MEIKVILPANKIPIGSIVSKITGTYKYKLVNDISIYDENSTKITINKNDPALLFLLPLDNLYQSNSITMIPDSKELIWYTTFEAFEEFRMMQVCTSFPFPKITL